eukprot:524899_1
MHTCAIFIAVIIGLLSICTIWYFSVCGHCEIGDYDKNDDWMQSFRLYSLIIGVGAMLSICSVCICCFSVGFRGGGIARRSLASQWQGNIGNVSGGSLFACLTSATMSGLPWFCMGAVGSIISYFVFVSLNQENMCC